MSVRMEGSQPPPHSPNLLPPFHCIFYFWSFFATTMNKIQVSGHWDTTKVTEWLGQCSMLEWCPDQIPIYNHFLRETWRWEIWGKFFACKFFCSVTAKSKPLITLSKYNIFTFFQIVWIVTVNNPQHQLSAADRTEHSQFLSVGEGNLLLGHLVWHHCQSGKRSFMRTCSVGFWVLPNCETLQPRLATSAVVWQPSQ